MHKTIIAMATLLSIKLPMYPYFSLLSGIKIVKKRSRLDKSWIREKANLKNCLTVKMKEFNLAKPRETDQIQDLALVQEAGHPHQVPLKNAPGPLQ